MGMVQLVDLTKCSIGAVSIARGTQASISVRDNRVRSAANGRVHARDTTFTEIVANVQAQDPLSVPLVLALTGLQTITVGGRVANSSSYQDYALANCVLLGFSFDLVDKQHGTCTYDLQNRADPGSTWDDELVESSGTRQAYVSRQGIIRLLETGTEFTDDAASELGLPGLERLSYQCRFPVHVDSSPDEVMADIVDVLDDPEITGTMTIRDSGISSAKALACRLRDLRRGTLTVACQQTGRSDGASAPAVKIVTLGRLKFHSPRMSVRSKQAGAWDIDFDQELLSAAGAEVSPSEIITMADAE